jgi:Na+/proline symporter
MTRGNSRPVAPAVFTVTLLLPVLVGLLVMARTHSQSDFLVGGRAMGRTVVALSAISSGRSSWPITLLDYLESRYDDHKHLLRVVGAVIITVFITAYVAAQPGNPPARRTGKEGVECGRTVV